MPRTSKTKHTDPPPSLWDKLNSSAYKNTLPYPTGSWGDPDVRKAREAYSAETSRLEEQFKADLFDEHGVTGNPKADRAYGIAWSMGHATGYSEVANYFSEIVDLIK